ncbi:HPr family phosphocarrier protein [Oscillospiraceae bacterium PP1C4]
MKSFNYKVNHPMGIHARPAGLLVKEAAKFTSDIQLITPNKAVDAKRIMAVMGAGVKCGDLVTITASGVDEAEAQATLQAFFAQIF